MAERLAAATAATLRASAAAPSARRAARASRAFFPNPSAPPARAGVALRAAPSRLPQVRTRPPLLGSGCSGAAGDADRNGAAADSCFRVWSQKARAVRCSAAAATAASDATQLKAAREDIRELLGTTHCHPILVRTVTFVKRLLAETLHLVTIVVYCARFGM